MIRSAKALALGGILVAVSFAQTANPNQTAPGTDNRASAYYNFAMGRLYALMAQAEGSQDNALKAIQYFKDALKADPKASDTYEELTDLYLALQRTSDATALAQDLLKQDPENVNAHRMLGRVYFSMISRGNQGQIDERALKMATQEFQKVTEKDPKDAESWVTLGRLYAGSGDSSGAEKALNAALSADPANEEALTQLASLYANNGEMDKAIEKLKSVADKGTSNERALLILAQAYESQKNFKDAAEILKKVLELQPGDEKIAAGLAEDLMRSGQTDEAVKVFAELAAHSPKDPKYYLEMADIYSDKADYAKAHEAIDKAKKIDPDALEPRLAEVQTFRAEGKLDQAIAGLKSILDDTARKSYTKDEQKQRAQWYELLGRLNVSAKHYPDAIEAFRAMSVNKDAGPQIAAEVIETYREARDLASAQREADAALKKFPDEYIVVREHATILADQGKIDDAAKELRSLLNGTRDRETMLALTELYQKAKRYDEAGKSLDEAEKLSTSDEDKLGVYFTRGALLERQKKYDASEAAFRKAIAFNPDTLSPQGQLQRAGAMNYLGYVFADRNVRLDEAYDLIQKAVELDPQNGAYLDSLGWVYFRQGKLSDAEKYLAKAVDLEIDDATVHEHLGEVYMKEGRTQDAISQWNASMKAFKEQPASDTDPDEVKKVSSNLDAARVKLAQEKKR